MEQDKEQSLVTDSRDMEAEKSCSDDLTEKTDVEAAVPVEEPGFSVEQEMFDGIKDDMEDVSEDRSTNLQHEPEETEDDDDDTKEEAEAQISLDSSLVLVQPNSEESGSCPDYQPLKISDEVEEDPQAQIYYENVLPQADDVEVYVGAKEDDGGSYEPQIFHHANFRLGAEFPWQTLLGFISVVLHRSNLSYACSADLTCSRGSQSLRTNCGNFLFSDLDGDSCSFLGYLSEGTCVKVVI